MNDLGKVFGILIILLLIGVLGALPVYNTSMGKADYKPKPKIVTEEKQCVKTKAWMTAEHMVLLNDWRDEAVREGNRDFVGDNGKIYDMSLSRTCMKCHPNKKEFCDECHNYTSVSPYCWDCHVEPKEND